MNAILNMFEKSFKHNANLAKFMGKALTGDKNTYLDKVDPFFLSDSDKKLVEGTEEFTVLKCGLSHCEYKVIKTSTTTTVVKVSVSGEEKLLALSNSIGEKKIEEALDTIFSEIMDVERELLIMWFDLVGTPAEERDIVEKTMIASMTPELVDEVVEDVVEEVVEEEIVPEEVTETVGEINDITEDKELNENKPKRNK